MRFLTGKHRVEYEHMIAENARLSALAEAWEMRWEHAISLSEKWSALWEKANARAERAIDAQLSVRGFPPVTPPDDSMPEFPDALTEDPEKVAALEKRMASGDATVFTERF